MKNIAVELKKILTALKKERAEIPQTNYFGEDNWEDMDLNIDLLEQALKDPTEKGIKDIIEDCEGEIEELEDNCDDNDEQAYTVMDRTRSMYNDLIDTLRGLI